MSCYQCGKWGHKRDQCPQRMVKIQCYECQKYGHYKNDCPVPREKLRKEKEASEAEEERLWVMNNVPNQTKILKNQNAVIQFIEEMVESEGSYGYFVSPCGTIQMKIVDGVIFFQYDGKGKCHPGFFKLFHKMNIEEFCYFLQERGLEGRLEYEKLKHGLEGLVLKLVTCGRAQSVHEKKSVHYFIDGEMVRYDRDERGWESTIVKGCEDLIYDTFDRVRGDGSSSREDTKTRRLELCYGHEL